MSGSFYLMVFLRLYPAFLVPVDKIQFFKFLSFAKGLREALMSGRLTVVSFSEYVYKWE